MFIRLICLKSFLSVQNDHPKPMYGKKAAFLSPYLSPKLKDGDTPTRNMNPLGR